VSESVLVAIAALFTTSCLVRIAPTFISLRIDTQTQRYFERLLPAAVFINFAVYIAYSEMVREPVPALISLAVVGAIALLNLLGLIGTAVLGLTLYFALVHTLG
jgi:branched-subunit amino acid transport protein AzlD